MSYFLFILIYLLQAYLIFLVANKLREKLAVFAWFPLANDYLITRLAKKPFYWLILMYIPLLNIYYDFILWREIFKRFNRNFLYALLMLVPILNWFGLLALAYLFKNPEKPASPKEIKLAETGLGIKTETAKTTAESSVKPVEEKSDSQIEEKKPA